VRPRVTRLSVSDHQQGVSEVEIKYKQDTVFIQPGGIDIIFVGLTLETLLRVAPENQLRSRGRSCGLRSSGSDNRSLLGAGASVSGVTAASPNGDWYGSGMEYGTPFFVVAGGSWRRELGSLGTWAWSSL
jgi:hypothetical protein